MQLQAQIDRRIEEYQKRPRKKFIGARATEYRFAQYEEDWRQKIERIGTLNYPSAARGKLYGNLRLTVTIRPDGSVQSVDLDRSSGLKVLDAAAFKIVRMASPFAPFPPDIRKDTDLLVITRTWFFGPGDTIWTK
jgi:protein TonB